VRDCSKSHLHSINARAPVAPGTHSTVHRTTRNRTRFDRTVRRTHVNQGCISSLATLHVQWMSVLRNRSETRRAWGVGTGWCARTIFKATLHTIGTRHVAVLGFDKWWACHTITCRSDTDVTCPDCETVTTTSIARPPFRPRGNYAAAIAWDNRTRPSVNKGNGTVLSSARGLNKNGALSVLVAGWLVTINARGTKGPRTPFIDNAIHRTARSLGIMLD